MFSEYKICLDFKLCLFICIVFMFYLRLKNVFKTVLFSRRNCLVSGYCLLLMVYVLSYLLLLDIPYRDLWK